MGAKSLGIRPFLLSPSPCDWPSQLEPVRKTKLAASCHKALARDTVAGKRGSTPAEAPSIFERLGIDPGAWAETVKDFGRLFKNVAGKSTSIEHARSLKTGRKFYRARV